MNVLVDTSVWSLALRRDAPPNIKETRVLARCLERHDVVFSTGIIVQELLQGFRGPKQRDGIVQHFSSLPLIVPELTDHIDAASLQTTWTNRFWSEGQCRRSQNGAFNVRITDIRSRGNGR